MAAIMTEVPLPCFGNFIKHRRSSKLHLPLLPFLHSCDRMYFSFAPNAKSVSLLWDFSHDAFSSGIIPRFPVGADSFQGPSSCKLVPTCYSPLLINFHRTSRSLGPGVYITHRTYIPSEIINFSKIMTFLLNSPSPHSKL